MAALPGRPGIRFDGTVSFGNLLVIAAVAFSGIAGWVANRERTFANAAGIERIDLEIKALDVRLRAVEIEIGRK